MIIRYPGEFPTGVYAGKFLENLGALRHPPTSMQQACNFNSESAQPTLDQSCATSPAKTNFSAPRRANFSAPRQGGARRATDGAAPPVRSMWTGGPGPSPW